MEQRPNFSRFIFSLDFQTNCKIFRFSTFAKERFQSHTVRQHFNVAINATAVAAAATNTVAADNDGLGVVGSPLSIEGVLQVEYSNREMVLLRRENDVEEEEQREEAKRDGTGKGATTLTARGKVGAVRRSTVRVWKTQIQLILRVLEGDE